MPQEGKPLLNGENIKDFSQQTVVFINKASVSVKDFTEIAVMLLNTNDYFRKHIQAALDGEKTAKCRPKSHSLK